MAGLTMIMAFADSKNGQTKPQLERPVTLSILVGIIIIIIFERINPVL